MLSPFPYLLCSRQAPAMPLSSSRSSAILTIASSPPLSCTWPLSCSWDVDYLVLHNMKPASVSSFSPLRRLILGPLWGLFILSQSSVLGFFSAPCSLPGQACLFPHWFQGYICIYNSQILTSGINLIPSFQSWSSSCLLSISWLSGQPLLLTDINVGGSQCSAWGCSLSFISPDPAARTSWSSLSMSSPSPAPGFPTWSSLLRKSCPQTSPPRKVFPCSKGLRRVPRLF